MEAISDGVEACYRSLFPGLLSDIGELSKISIITLMIIKNRAVWLARSFTSSHYNHCPVIITLKASSFQNGSQICWCFRVGNWSIILFSQIIIHVYTKTIIISCLRRCEYRQIVTSTSSQWLFAISKIQLVVYYQCCILIAWATTRLYVIAH